MTRRPSSIRHLTLTLTLMVILLPRNPQLVGVLATDGIFDTSLYQVRDIGYFFLPCWINPAMVSCQQRGTGLKETVYTKQVKAALKAAQREKNIDEKGRGSLKYEKKVFEDDMLCFFFRCLRGRTVILGLISFAGLYGLASRLRKEEDLGPDAIYRTRPPPKESNHPQFAHPKVESKPQGGGGEVWKVHLPHDVKTVSSSYTLKLPFQTPIINHPHSDQPVGEHRERLQGQPGSLHQRGRPPHPPHQSARLLPGRVEATLRRAGKRPSH